MNLSDEELRGKVRELISSVLALDDVGVSVECSVCGKRKGPSGRAVPDEMANGMCDRDCDGYYEEPDPGDLWPGERRLEFGYGFRFDRVKRAVELSGDLSSLITDDEEAQS